MNAAEVLTAGRTALATDQQLGEAEARALNELLLGSDVDAIDRGALMALDHALGRQSHERAEKSMQAHEELWREFQRDHWQPGGHFDRRHPEVQRGFWEWKAARDRKSAAGVGAGR